MLSGDTLIPARFLTILSHICVVATLLWQSQEITMSCLPTQYQIEDYLQTYHSRLVAVFATSLTFSLVELVVFLAGITMFKPGLNLLSVGFHVLGVLCLADVTLAARSCDYFWWIFAFCDLPPFCANTTNELQRLTQSTEFKGSWSFYLVLAGVATTLGSSLPVGYNIGVVNTPADVIKSWCNVTITSRYDIVLSDTWLGVLWSAVVSVFIVGGCTGSVLGSVLANSIGRKMAIIITSLLSIVGAVMFMFCREADSVEMLVLGRLLVGLSAGLTTSILPMYLSELAPPSLTGPMGAFCPMGVCVGVLVGQVMGLKFLLGRPEHWPYLLSVFVLLVIICLPVYCLLPESPKYLFVVRRNEQAAVKQLSRIRGVSPSCLSEDIEVLREEVLAVEAAAEQGWSMLRVAHSKRLLLPLLLVASMQAGQQTSGINAVFYYSQTIFKQARLSEENAQYATIGCGVINACTALLMLHLLPRCGRRALLLASVGASAATLAALPVAMAFMDTVQWMPYVCMVVVFLYVCVYGFGLGPIPYFIASELFEVAPRGAGMAWGSLANWTGNFLVGMLFPTMRHYLGLYTFLVFSAITTLLFVFLKMYFPETRGAGPAQVAELCSRGLRSTPLHTRRI